MEIKKVGVVGCGLMGSGIAQVCAQSGYAVVVSELSEPLLEKGITSISSILARGVEKGRITKEEKEATLGRIKGTLAPEDFAACDIIVEAITEDLGEKKKVFASLDKLCPPQVILASNTSSLSVLALAMVTRRPEKVLGLHFFNPAPVMKLLELVKTLATSEETVATARRFGESLGKTVVLTKDSCGFIVNRLLVPYLLDAIRLYEIGLATREDIDNAMTLGCNHPMGPLMVADLIGLDIVFSIGCALYEEFKDPGYAPPPLLKKMVTAGRLGRKVGRGFYDYQQPK